MLGALANSLELNYVFVSKAMKEFSFFEENSPVFFVLSQQLFDYNEIVISRALSDKDRTK